MTTFRFRRFFAWTAGAIFAVAVAVLIVFWMNKSRLSEEEVRQIVITTIQKEAPESFLVTGYLDLTATITIENTKYLLPDLFRFNLGTTRSTVRVPGRVSYGFDVTQLNQEAVKLTDDQSLEVTLPDLRVYSVEPDLEKMEVETSVGWARLDVSSGRRVEQKAIRSVRNALQNQAEQHIKQSVQPRVNTARAIEKLLTPILEVAGMDHPQISIRVEQGLTLEPEG